MEKLWFVSDGNFDRLYCLFKTYTGQGGVLYWGSHLRPPSMQTCNWFYLMIKVDFHLSDNLYWSVGWNLEKGKQSVFRNLVEILVFSSVFVLATCTMHAISHQSQKISIVSIIGIYRLVRLINTDCDDTGQPRYIMIGWPWVGHGLTGTWAPWDIGLFCDRQQIVLGSSTFLNKE